MVEPVLHGREEPLRMLRSALDAALSGRGQLALISGEAGIGKTAMASAVAREAEARGATVTWGRAWEFADAPPHFPLWPCLRALGLATGDERRSEADSYRFWEDVVTALARAARTTPAVWILEDLHAADMATLDLLTFLAQPLRAMRVLVIATARAQDSRLTERMRQRLTRMGRDGTDVRLEALGPDDVAALVEESLGRSVPPAAVTRLIELTAGNPLFVVECARAFKAANGVEGTIAALPPTVRQVVLERVTLLADSTRIMLQHGAVLGRTFSAALVARMAGTLPARVIDTLLPALRAGLVTEPRPGHFLFSHTLVRDAIEDALGAEERAGLHGRAERALEALGDTSEVLVERARHALIAVVGGDEARVVAVAERALAMLEREGAFDRAYDLHARLEEARRAGLLPPSSLLRKLHVARIARAGGRSDAARALCREIALVARERSEPALLAEAALVYGADLRPGVVDRSLVDLLEEARSALGETEPVLACRVLARLAAALQPANDTAGPVALAMESIARARATGDEQAILEVLEMAGSALVDCAPVADRLAAAEELLERALRAGDLAKAMRARMRLAFDHLEVGDFNAFGRDTDHVLELSSELGHPRHRWRALLLASGRASCAGAFAESDGHVVEVSRLSGLADDPGLAMTLLAHDVMRLRLQRRDEELRALLEKMPSVMTDVPLAGLVMAVVRSTCFARMGDVEATRRELESTLTNAAIVESDLSFAGWIAEAHARAGTDENRRRLRERLASAPAEEIVGSHITLTYEGSVARLVGLLDASLGDLPSAEAHLREAHTRAVARGHLPWVAQLAFELSTVLLQMNRAGEAATLLEQSTTIARTLGMSGLARLAGPAAQHGVSLSPAPAVHREASVVRDGDGWRVERGDRVARVRDTRGMQLLARLVQRAGEEVHVLALASDEAGSMAESHAGDVVDERARAQYRQRVGDLDEDVAEAERHGDLARLERLRHEREALVSELSRAVGLGGRARQAGSATERARVNVQRRVKDAVNRIAAADHELGRFFEGAVRTGTFCCFQP